MINLHVMIEGIAVITGILCVWFNVRQNILTWPTAIVSSAIFAVVFFDARLYTTMLLQGLFIVISIYGWRAWLTGGPEGGTLLVTRIKLKTSLLLSALLVLGTIGFIYILTSFAESNHPILESITTSLSVIASWMAARKLLESWLVWITTDLIYLGLYFVTELYLTLLLYALYLGLATSGYLQWRKSYLQSLSERNELSVL
ncbi:MAG: nicotinamide riboside transporter PnuC [Bacteroidetes bacterium]|nr:nicotinamide riboside transporter PnuC [Bacteroidota bacterium]